MTVQEWKLSVFQEDSAGGHMDTDSITVRPRHTLELVLRYLRLRKELPSVLTLSLW